MNEDCARLMGRVGLAAASFTFTLGWDETEFGRVVWWVGEMEGGMKGDRRRLLRIFFWEYLDHEDTNVSWLSFILQTFTNNVTTVPSLGQQAAHLLFLLLGPADDDLALLPHKGRDNTSTSYLSTPGYRAGLTGASCRSRSPPPTVGSRRCSLT